MTQDMETFAARLATFDLVLHPETRRNSSTKSAKPISWPHNRPSPAELAHAGFFYNPYETNPDNTTCFLCRRALDGWEEDDNPITEHLKHAKDCGWAIMMDIQQHSSNPAEIEDPTSDRITQARQATFGESWPHDGKRGWVCQSEKMVEGGWYFCPNEESVDLASCAYCKLSLDGWEPKDDPFDEHYRRSADCSFFAFAKPPTKGKGSRSKKGRTSKASRLSTQSTVSEVPASDIEDSMDQSILSQPAKGKSTKKGPKAKSKGTKSRKDDVGETDSQMDIDEVEYSHPEPSKPKRATRGKKRSSVDVDRDDMSILEGEAVGYQEPPAKKRATKSRSSIQQQQSSTSIDGITEAAEDHEAIPDEEQQKLDRATKKKSSGKGRKASGASSSSKTTAKPRVPRDSELEAEIEAGLETDEPETREALTEENEIAPIKEISKKSKSKKKATKRDPENLDDVPSHAEGATQFKEDQEPDQYMHEVNEPPVQHKSKSKKKEGKQGNEKGVRNEREDAVMEGSAPQGDSFISVEITSKPLSNDSELEQSDKTSKKKIKKKASSEKTKKSKKADKKSGEAQNETKGSPEMQPSREAQIGTPEPNDQQDLQEQDFEQSSNRRRSSRVPPKTAERYSDIPQEKQLAKSLAESRELDYHQSPADTKHPVQRAETVSPLPPPSRGTPSLSPQSSDAENQPPSLKPSAPRPQMTSPSKQVRIPLAISTPSPSKQNSQSVKLRTSHPWVPIDIDDIILAGSGDKENIDLRATFSNMKGELTSPEKKMSVQEWIMWNAKNGEERLKRECERLVGQFEKEGARAMRALEGIECID